jgi:Mg/Co/Ni transporter MgtE
VGAVIAALSGPISQWWNVPRTELVVGGVSFLVLGPVLLLGLSRVRPVSRGLVLAFGISNLLLAPTLWAAAALGWLPLTAAGNWSLASAGDVALVLGVWQLSALRR